MRLISALLVGLAVAGNTHAQGLLVPEDTSVPPLALVGHEVRVAIENQVAETHVVQTFRNHTSRALEATYVFPVPRGASVTKFTMWVDGKEMKGELVEADKARTIYTDIVRRLQDPGLLEHLGNDLMKVRIFPVPAHGEQKVTVTFTSLASSDAGLIEYIYPLKADGKSASRLAKFSLTATLKTEHPIQNVYSPTHEIKIRRPSEREAIVHFEGKQELRDRDFQLYYTTGAKDVGLTALVRRTDPDQKGFFMLLISPRAELAKMQQVPRDMVFVLDTSGSMAGKRIIQAKNALKFCLRNLDAKDRFGMIHFATAVTPYKNTLVPATPNQIEQAQSWVQDLDALGSTNIDEALATALAMRPPDASRNFTIVFFTDGQPTIGECNPDRIIKNVVERNTANTRIFTFGVGDDVNAVLLDQLAAKTRSVATYVRESEDIEAKVSGLYAKISRPVLTDLKLSVGDNVTISDVYPPQLPDLFHGNQLVVLGRYHGKGHAAVKLTGMVGKERKDFDYEVKFPDRTAPEKAFVEDLWARRKVGYMLDNIRIHGENKETRDEVLKLARKYGIATPYTSYLVVPDVAPRVTANGMGMMGMPGMGMGGMGMGGMPGMGMMGGMNMMGNSMMGGGMGLMGASPGMMSGMSGMPGMGMMGGMNPMMGGMGMMGAAPGQIGGVTMGQMTWGPMYLHYPMVHSPFQGPMFNPTGPPSTLTPSTSSPPPPVKQTLQIPVKDASAQSGKEGVDLSLLLSDLRNQDRVSQATVRQAAGRKLLNLHGVWTDEGAHEKLPVVKIKAQSEAYFDMLKRHPEMREVFQLGNRIVWVTPSGAVLVIDEAAGAEQLSDADIDQLFRAKK